MAISSKNATILLLMGFMILSACNQKQVHKQEVKNQQEQESLLTY